MVDLLNENMRRRALTVIHLWGEDIEVRLHHGCSMARSTTAFHRTEHAQGGKGGTAFCFQGTIVKTIRDFYRKDYDPST
jgi:topoisomerase-4 subunit B